MLSRQLVQPTGFCWELHSAAQRCRARAGSGGADPQNQIRTANPASHTDLKFALWYQLALTLQLDLQGNTQQADTLCNSTSAELREANPLPRPATEQLALLWEHCPGPADDEGAAHVSEQTTAPDLKAQTFKSSGPHARLHSDMTATASAAALRGSAWSSGVLTGRQLDGPCCEQMVLLAP
ncbi:hypothetical protein Anapl_02410 [Anas platyrhynchos]|uniref:Uncharacterized protein n=1 Tax=Anas platyrhynchos TaxID=8839 RepID=R0LKZ4_ANAPL|nr:hypothetical protein Anapl_02410 [Anas platyrhynchos]